MMVALLAVAALQPLPDAPPAPYAQEVLVLGERLKEAKFRAGVKDGQYYCEPTLSSGEAELDAIYCDAMRYCADYAETLFVQYDDELRSRRTAKAARARIDAALSTCLNNTTDRMIDNLAEQRWQSRQMETGTTP